MAKELPYWQFEPAEYLTGNIQFCTLAAQGLFTNIKSVYWQRKCCMTKEQLFRKFDTHHELLKELIDEKIIKVKGKNIYINFLDKQYLQISVRTNKLSEAGKAGYKKKASQPKAEIQATPEATLKHLDKIREDKIRKEKMKEEEAEIIAGLKVSDSWIESVLMTTKVTKEKLIDYLDLFAAHRTSIEQAFNGRQDYIKHFTNWLRIQVKTQKAELVKTNQTTPLSFAKK